MYFSHFIHIRKSASLTEDNVFPVQSHTRLGNISTGIALRKSTIGVV